ncbi:MAG: hypothetical protein HYR60_05705 [Acidobacteria bacterium]|nr:hypothetical protein [Acidobacteriota bacterium]
MNLSAKYRAAALAVTALWAAAPKQLVIAQASIHQTDDGPAMTPGTVFVPGETIFFTAFFDKYEVSKQRVLISYRIEALDAKNIPLMEAVAGKVDAELSAEDKNWRPKIRQEVFIPPLADSGGYRVRVAAKDELNNTTAVKEVSFTVRGQDVEPSDTLILRNLRFYRSEDEAQPLAIAAYRPGDTVCVRFDMTGYKLGPGNEVHVSYIVSVTSPGGKVLFTQKEPTVEKSTSFYPKRYTPSLFNLSLTPNIARGEYSITIIATDHAGTQTYETKPTFRIE